MIPTKAILNQVKKVAPTQKVGAKNGQTDYSDIKKKAIIVGLLGIGAFVTIKVAGKVVKKYKKTRSEQKFTQEGQQALLFYSAINRVGIPWLKWADGTDEEAIYTVARSITDFKKVQKEFMSQFNTSLVQELQKELTTEEYQKFMNIINSRNSQGTNSQANYLSQNTTNTSLPVVTNNKVLLIDKGAKAYKRFLFYPFGSIKELPEKSYFYCTATGNTKTVRGAFAIKHIFIEVQVQTSTGKTATVYLDKDDVRLLSAQEFMNSYYADYSQQLFTDEEID